MSEMKPNHICKNVNCTKGVNGGRKEYYACDFCDRTRKILSVACSEECFIEYQNQVLEARSKGKTVNVLPERTDISSEEVEELMNKPFEVVFEESKEELKDFADEDGNVNFTEAVEIINTEIDKKKITTRSRKKKNDEQI